MNWSKFLVANGTLLMTVGLFAFSQDRWGSLEAFIAHIREPGVWVQVPIWVWNVLIVIGAVMQSFGWFAQE